MSEMPGAAVVVVVVELVGGAVDVRNGPFTSKVRPGLRWELRYSLVPEGSNAGPVSSDPDAVQRRNGATPPSGLSSTSSMFPPSSAT